MNRRVFISAVMLGVGVWHRTARAQQPGKVYRVGHLAATAPSPQNTSLLTAFHSELRERGWVEGRNIRPTRWPPATRARPSPS